MMRERLQQIDITTERPFHHLLVQLEGFGVRRHADGYRPGISAATTTGSYPIWSPDE